VSSVYETSNTLYLDSLWEKILEILKDEIPRSSFETWLLSTRLSDFTNNTLTITVSNDFIKEWIENRYAPLIKSIIQNYLNKPVTLTFTVEAPLNTKNNTSLNPGDRDNQNMLSSPLNPKYSFDNFVIGNSNRFAHAASLAVADSPAKSYNPLFLYGGSGLGKTHLMHAIGQLIKKKFPYMQVVYITGEQFTNELIDSIRY